MNKVLPVITESTQYLQRRPRAQPRDFASYGEIQRYLAQEHQVYLRYSEVARFRQPLAQQLRHRVRQAHRAGYTQCRVWALADFPQAGTTTHIQWEQASQNFVIVAVE